MAATASRTRCADIDTSTPGVNSGSGAEWCWVPNLPSACRACSRAATAAGVMLFMAWVCAGVSPLGELALELLEFCPTPLCVRVLACGWPVLAAVVAGGFWAFSNSSAGPPVDGFLAWAGGSCAGNSICLSGFANLFNCPRGNIGRYLITGTGRSCRPGLGGGRLVGFRHPASRAGQGRRPRLGW